MENRMFAEMLKAARAWLVGRDPEEIASNAGAEFDGEGFCVSTLGRDVRVGWPGLEMEPELPGWYALVILHYLHLADGAPLSGDFVPFGRLKDGMIRGGGYDRSSAVELGRLLKDRSEAEIRAACESLGGRMVDSNADLCAELPFLPRFPVMLKVWLADEEDEIDLSARLMVNAAADHYLTIEDAVTVGMVVQDALKAYFQA